MGIGQHDKTIMKHGFYAGTIANLGSLCQLYLPFDNASLLSRASEPL